MEPYRWYISSTDEQAKQLMDFLDLSANIPSKPKPNRIWRFKVTLVDNSKINFLNSYLNKFAIFSEAGIVNGFIVLDGIVFDDLTNPNTTKLVDANFLMNIEILEYETKQNVSQQPMMNGPLLINNNCLLWLDAADPYGTGKQPSTASPLITWKDKSGFSHDAIYETGGGDNQNIPPVNIWNSNTLNNKPSIYLYGNARYYGNFSPLGNMTHIFGVVSMNINSDRFGRLIGMGNGTITQNNNDQLAFCRDWKTTFDLFRPNQKLVNNSTNISYDQPYIWEAWYDGTNAYTTVLQGNSTTILNIAFSSNLGYDLFTIGSAPSRKDNTVGFFSEIIVYNKALTKNEREVIEGYLSWKWGLNNNLPSTHPYKSSAPQ